MPFSSEQISQMNAQYQQQAMGGMQYASMIGAGAPMAESVTGGAMNRMAAVGGPMMMGGLGVMGLDPVSLGLRAGMGASRMGLGFMGAGAVGLGAAGVAGAGMMAAGYGANQVFTGAQQQQQFNSSMNSTFRFANQYGGQGFGRGGNSEIGGMMRQMTTEQGPGGQMVGFEELGRLASNMGRMGMAQGVRDAKEFSEKFREMIKSVKEIATQMNTSLEEAQKMMSSMRSSGVFGAGNASRVSSRIRAGSVAGGMATSELTGMMQVGSQISRAVGGRGRAGAMGGLETITNIGVAQQMGILSEEDIYNTTGLTGAEGRRAMATRQMEQSAKFFQSSTGRRFLASVAGKGGSLDEGSIEEYLAGGVGTNRTMQMANRNLGKIGRADFVRNEGKLRGSAMERLGGLAPMVAMKGWLDERGINVNEDNDRAMIFMQRQLGMGNDEAEMMLRQVRELPQILRQRQISSRDDAYASRMSERKGHQGLEGLKKKFESARAQVQATLQQVGADFYSSMSGTVESFINRMTDTYVKETRQGVDSAFRSALGGGAAGTQAARTTFGIGAGNLSSIFGSSSPFAGKGPDDMLAFQKSDAERFSKAGFGFEGGSLSGHIGMVSQVANAFRGGDAGLSGREGVQSLGKRGTEALRAALLNRQVSGKGMERLESFGKFLQGQSGKGDHGADELAQRFAAAGAVEKAQIMAAYSGEGGAGFDQSANFLDPGLKGVFGTSKFATKGEGDEAVGNAFSNFDPAAAGRDAARNSMLVGGPGGMIFNAPTQSASPNAKAIGSFLRSEGGRSMIDKMFRGDKKTRDETFRSASEEVMKLQDKGGDRTGEESGRMQALKGIILARQLNEMRVNGASPEQIEAEAARLAKENGLSVDQVRAQVDTVISVAEDSRLSAVGQAGERAGEEARDAVKALQRGRIGGEGLVTGSGANLQLNANAVSKLKAGKAGEAFLGAMVEKQRALSQIGPGMDKEEVDRLFQQGINAGQKMGDLLAGMSVAEQRALASGLEGVEGTDEVRSMAGRSAAMGGMIEGGAKKGKGGGLSTAAGMLGVNVTKGEAGKMGAAELAKKIASSLGPGVEKDDGLMQTLTDALGSIESGNTGKGVQGLQQFMDSEGVQKARIAKADSENPNKNLETIAGHTEKMAKSMVDTLGVLQEMNKRAQGNAEDWNPLS